MRESKWYVRLFRRLYCFVFGWLIKEEEIPKAELCRMARDSGECHGEFCDACAWYEGEEKDESR